MPALRVRVRAAAAEAANTGVDVELPVAPAGWGREHTDAVVNAVGVDGHSAYVSLRFADGAIEALPDGRAGWRLVTSMEPGEVLLVDGSTAAHSAIQVSEQKIGMGREELFKAKGVATPARAPQTSGSAAAVSSAASAAKSGAHVANDHAQHGSTHPPTHTAHEQHPHESHTAHVQHPHESHTANNRHGDGGDNGAPLHLSDSAGSDEHHTHNGAPLHLSDSAGSDGHRTHDETRHAPPDSSTRRGYVRHRFTGLQLYSITFHWLVVECSIAFY
jgi:hypothetical protein